jgi:hypothetical protein
MNRVRAGKVRIEASAIVLLAAAALGGIAFWIRGGSGSGPDRPRGGTAARSEDRSAFSHGSPMSPPSGVAGEDRPAPAAPPRALPELSPRLSDWISEMREKIAGHPPATPGYRSRLEKLIQLFADDPATVDQAADLLEADPTLPYFGQTLLVTAIARFQDPVKAQKLLLRLARSADLNEEVRLALVSQMAIPTALPPETSEYLDRLSREPGRVGLVALDALGRMVRKMGAEGDPRAPAQVHAWVVEYDRARTAKDSRRASRVLLALGEAGTAEAWPLLKSALLDPNPSLRAAAVEAVGRHGNPERLDIALRVLRDDPIPTVALGALKALYPAPGQGAQVQSERLGEIPLSLTAAVADVLAVHRDSEVRLEILRYYDLCFERGVAPPPRVVEVVRRLAGSDPVEDVRMRANRILTQKRW